MIDDVGGFGMMDGPFALGYDEMNFKANGHSWDNEQAGGTATSSDKIVESLVPLAWDLTSAGNRELAKREKAYFLEEDIVLIDSKKTDLFGLDLGIDEAAFGEKGLLSTDRTRWRRPVFVFPLTSAEFQIDDSLMNLHAGFGFDSNSDIEENRFSPLATCRQNILDSQEFKFLFSYSFPLQRMIALITIYNSNSMTLSKPELLKAFYTTRTALKTLYYTLKPPVGKHWYEVRPKFSEQVGGNAGYMNICLQADTSKGPDFSDLGLDIDLQAIVMMTVPRIIRGIADYVDPHYKTVGHLIDFGLWSLPKNWKSVPPLWPSTFPLPWPPLVGWGPPLGMWGMMAYGMPQLKGDRKKLDLNRDFDFGADTGPACGEDEEVEL